MKKILIIGGSDFIGSHVSLVSLKKYPNCRFIRAEITIEILINKLFQKQVKSELKYHN